MGMVLAKISLTVVLCVLGLQAFIIYELKIKSPKTKIVIAPASPEPPEIRLECPSFPELSCPEAIEPFLSCPTIKTDTLATKKSAYSIQVKLNEILKIIREWNVE
jgi:hypothetical protein